MNEVTITLTNDQLSLFAQGLTALRLKLDEVAFSVQAQINAQRKAPDPIPEPPAPEVEVPVTEAAPGPV